MFELCIIDMSIDTKLFPIQIVALAHCSINFDRRNHVSICNWVWYLVGDVSGPPITCLPKDPT